jgi:glycosyltransferase involved in cell wall biosynthesis
MTDSSKSPAPGEIIPEISVVICTYNRSQVLINAVRTACEQSVPKNQYEVIVIDNNSTDSTAGLIRDLMPEHTHLRYFMELEQGLSSARNRGWREARGRYVAYLDDDAKAPPDWLAKAHQIIIEIQPALLGGPYYPWYNSRKPPWFLDQFGTNELDTIPRFLEPPSSNLSGGNLFICRDLLEKIGGFDVNLGMTGQNLAYGEETALQILIRQQYPDEKIYYDPELRILHLVRDEKMTFRWRVRELFWRGVYQVRVQSGYYHGEPASARPLKILVKSMLRLALNLTVGLMKYDRRRFPCSRSYLYAKGLRPVVRFGRCFAMFKWRQEGNRHVRNGSNQSTGRDGTS